MRERDDLIDRLTTPGFMAHELASRSVDKPLKQAKWGVWCVRSAASQFGPAASWMKKGDGLWEGTEEEARAEAARLRKEVTSPNLNYHALEMS